MTIRITREQGLERLNQADRYQDSEVRALQQSARLLVQCLDERQRDQFIDRLQSLGNALKDASKKTLRSPSMPDSLRDEWLDVISAVWVVFGPIFLELTTTLKGQSQ